MKKLMLILPLLIFCTTLSFGQQPPRNKADRIIEGGQLAVDIVNIFKKGGNKKDKAASSDEDCNEGISELCFQNKGKNAIKVIVKFKENTTVEPTELIIPAKGEECSFIQTQGIYSYQVQEKNEKGEYVDIRKGEMIVKPCEEITKNIKE